MSLDANKSAALSRPPSRSSQGRSKRKMGETDSDDRDSKRSRTEEEPYRRHERFWLPRGENIIRVKDVIFKISISLLEENSSYFANLFSHTSVENEASDTQYAHPTLEGRVVYHVEKSNPVDFAHLLDVLYHAA